MAGIQVDGANQKLVLDSDGDTYLEAATDDTVKVYVAGAQDFTITANTLTAESGSTIAAQALTATTVTASGILKTDDATEATSTTDGSLQTDGGLSVVKDAVFGDDVKLLSDSSVIAFGADGDTTLTHTDGTGLTLNGTNKLCFNDATQFIQGASGTVLDIAATDEIELNATLVDLNGNLDVSGTTLLPTLGVGAAKDLGVGLHVKSGDSGASVDGGGDELVVESSGAGGISILTGNTSTGKLAFGDDGAASKFSVNYDHSTDLMKINTASAIAIQMNQDGIVTKPLQPAFHVTNAAQNNLGTDASATITFSTEVFDVNADFDVSNYTFTAPVTGKYMLTFHMTLNAMDSASPFTYAHLDTSNREYYSWYDNNLELSGDAGYVTFHISVLADMDANDTALGKVFIGGGTAQTDLATATNTWFTGFLAC